MKATKVLTVASLTMALAARVAVATADSAAATCEVRKDGDTKQGASGPCTFSQRQGYIDITLRNGDTVSLSPTGKANHFRDQKGNKVVRTEAGGGKHEYKWEGRKIIVTFGGAYGTAQPAHSGKHGHGGGADQLQYLVNGPKVGGEVDDEMMRRGYKSVGNRVDGKDVWSYWRDKSSGECVVLHFHKSVVKSVAPAPDRCR